MSVRQAPSYQQGAPERPQNEDSDGDEEALANEYKEQVGFDDGEDYDLNRSTSMGGGPQDLQAQLHDEDPELRQLLQPFPLHPEQRGSGGYRCAIGG